MKRYLLTILFASITSLLFAQWTNSSNSNNINNTNSGNVGIGTATPSDKLTIRDSNIPYDSASGLVKLSFDSGAGFGGFGFEKETFNTGGLRFFTQYGYSNTTERMRITGSGNVGIGTTSPNAKLEVSGAILLPGSVNNVTQRPSVGTTRITGEISGYSGSGAAYDDGFLRLSAGAGTNAVKTYIDLSGYSTLPDMDRNIVMGTNGKERVRIDQNGNLGIGTTVPDQKLTVNGTIHASQVKVDTQIPVPDYVFKKDYKLTSLAALKTYLDKNQHLPEIPSASEQEKQGLDLGKMNQLLLKKVEELTLYLIEEQAQNKKQNLQIKRLERKVLSSKAEKHVVGSL